MNLDTSQLVTFLEEMNIYKGESTNTNTQPKTAELVVYINELYYNLGVAHFYAHNYEVARTFLLKFPKDSKESRRTRVDFYLLLIDKIKHGEVSREKTQSLSDQLAKLRSDGSSSDEHILFSLELDYHIAECSFTLGFFDKCERLLDDHDKFLNKLAEKKMSYEAPDLLLLKIRNCIARQDYAKCKDMCGEYDKQEFTSSKFTNDLNYFKGVCYLRTGKNRQGLRELERIVDSSFELYNKAVCERVRAIFHIIKEEFTGDNDQANDAMIDLMQKFDRAVADAVNEGKTSDAQLISFLDYKLFILFYVERGDLIEFLKKGRVSFKINFSFFDVRINFFFPIFSWSASKIT